MYEEMLKEEVEEHFSNLENIDLIAELTKYVKRYEDEMDKYAQGRCGAYKVALALTRQLDEPQKPFVPNFVAGWIEKSTDNLTKAEKIAYLIKSKDGDSYYFCDWFVLDGIVTQEQGEELLAWATRQSYETLLSLYNGYEVEKEPLYCVKIGKGYFSGFDETKVTYVIDDAPGALAQRIKYDSKEEAEMDALQIGGTVEEVVEG